MDTPDDCANPEQAPTTASAAIESERQFDSYPTHVRAAREFVARMLYAHGWPVSAVDRARVVLSELATNAVLHAQTPFIVRCRVEGDALIEVTDWRPDSTPLVADPDPERVGGLGLRLVDAMATDWGVSTTPEFKVVWCRLPVGGAEQLVADVQVGAA